MSETNNNADKNEIQTKDPESLPSKTQNIVKNPALTFLQSQCNCPPSTTTPSSSGISDTLKQFHCPVCLGKFNAAAKIPIGLKCGHTLCQSCVKLLVPAATGDIDESVGVPNVALLEYIGHDAWDLLSKVVLDEDHLITISHLVEIAELTKGQTLSRALHRKLLTLLSTPVNPPCQPLLLKAIKSLGERILHELVSVFTTASNSNSMTHYQAQQQLWGAIRARACQFLGPAMQEETLKLVLLALEDGSALSRKVLVMFVVQRLVPQFPQASKTSVGHVIQLLYRASTFEVIKRPGNSSLMTLRNEFRNYEALRREHDIQIVKIGMEAGIRFTPEQWSGVLYGDYGGEKRREMQSIVDKLQAPSSSQQQSFDSLLKEWIVVIQRRKEKMGEGGNGAENDDGLMQMFPHFQVLCQIGDEMENDTSHCNWSDVEQALESLEEITKNGMAKYLFVGENKKGKRFNR